MMKEKIALCFERLQNLDIKPTKQNMELLLQTMYDLQDVYNSIKDGEPDGRAAVGSE